jgi:hypothetical protein
LAMLLEVQVQVLVLVLVLVLCQAPASRILRQRMPRRMPTRTRPR